MSNDALRCDPIGLIAFEGRSSTRSTGSGRTNRAQVRPGTLLTAVSTRLGTDESLLDAFGEQLPTSRAEASTSRREERLRRP